MADNSTLDQVWKRLDNLGLGAVVESTADLDFYADLVADVIKADLCRNEIPKALWRVYIDMVCGEFLRDKLMSGDLDEFINPEIGKGDISNVRMGDFTVGINAGTSQRKLLEDLIQSLRSNPDYSYLFSYYRDFIR